MKHPAQPPAECPICGASVPRNAKACPQCGADENTGWNEEATRYDGLELPDVAFEDEVRPQTRSRRSGLAPTGVPYFTWAVAALILVLLVALVLTQLSW